FPGGTDVQKLIRHQTEKPYPLEELRPGLPPEVHQILNRMLEKRPEDRYPTPRHLVEALELYLNPALPSTPVPHSVAETPPVADTPVPNRHVTRASSPPLPPSAQTRPAPSQSMRDTMPIPADLAEALPFHSPTTTRSTGQTSIPITRPRTPFAAHNGLIGGLAFSPDGRLLVTAGIDGRVRLWDITGPTAREVGNFSRPGIEFQSVVFAPDDDYLVAGGIARGTAGVWRWDWNENKLVEWGQYQGDKVGVPALAFAPDGKRLAAAIGPFVVAFKVSNRQAGTGEILKGHSGAVRAVAWSPDGKRLASGGESKHIVVWSWGWLGASQKAKVRAHTDILTGLAISPDGCRLAAIGLDKQVVLWDAEEMKEGTTLSLTGHHDPLRLAHYLKDGPLVTISQTGHMIVWDTRAATAIAEYNLSDRMAPSLTISMDGKHVATGSTDGRVSIFETIRVASGATVGN
ncbi:MAG TPA: hypothetical protein VHR66_29760, partial [Gemmataceae bacterium]|nr:hypothetical protein [Gemmataceae bacterium]